MTKIEEEKIKLHFNNPQASIKDVEATGEKSLQPSKENIKYFLKKKNLLTIFSIFVGHFCPPGSGSGLRIRIRIQIRNTFESGSDPDPDPQHWFP
jgi:hypothetical protein